jgi:hypothetical protein
MSDDKSSDPPPPPPRDPSNAEGKSMDSELRPIVPPRDPSYDISEGRNDDE